MWSALAQTTRGPLNRAPFFIIYFWNSCIKKKLKKAKLDPIAHQPIIRDDVIEAADGDQPIGPNTSYMNLSGSINMALPGQPILEAIDFDYSGQQWQNTHIP